MPGQQGFQLQRKLRGKCTKNLDLDQKPRYQDHLKDGMRVLDLMSSWQSHLPDSLSFHHVAGHGLNRAELLANETLDSWFIQDLNVDQKLQLGDATLDAVLCALSVQYLQYPEKVFAEVYRVLAPSGLFIISFSKHCFREKAIAGWLKRSTLERAKLLSQLLRRAGFTEVHSITPRPLEDWEPTPISDPFCALVARKAPALKERSPDPDGYQFSSCAAETLKDVPEGSGEGEEEQATGRQLEIWIDSYREMQLEAEELGIPKRAIPQLEEPVSLQRLREARDLLRGIIESRLSSNL